MNLKELVPPENLCRQIPEGKFADSALIWMNGNVIVRIADIPNTFPPSMRKSIYPAPTLEEILAHISYSLCQRLSDRWRVDSYTKFSATEKYDQKATVAALKLWFEVKGTEDEE